MIEIWAFDMGSGALGNCAEFLHAGLAPTAWQALKAFPGASVTTRVMVSPVS